MQPSEAFGGDERTRAISACMSSMPFSPGIWTHQLPLRVAPIFGISKTWLSGGRHHVLLGRLDRLCRRPADRIFNSSATNQQLGDARCAAYLRELPGKDGEGGGMANTMERFRLRRVLPSRRFSILAFLRLPVIFPLGDAKFSSFHLDAGGLSPPCFGAGLAWGFLSMARNSVRPLRCSVGLP